jgi:hypothetical protein
MKKILPILILASLLCTAGYAQETVYHTWEARLQLNGEMGNEAVRLQTDEVRIRLDYETTEMILRFPVKSLRANVDTINQVLRYNLSEAVFVGALSLDFINTESDAPQKFTIGGDLTVNDVRTRVRGEGELHQINDKGMLSCMLGFTMHLNLNDLHINKPWPDMEDEFEVVVMQALLKNEKQ